MEPSSDRTASGKSTSPEARPLPSSRTLRRASPAERRKLLDELCMPDQDGIAQSFDRVASSSTDALEFADAMVENAWGLMGIPLGLCPSLRVDGREYLVPMATEEPSVIAAASYAANLVGMHGGFETAGAEPLMRGHVYLQDHRGPSGLQNKAASLENLEKARPELEALLKERLESMARRGGGFRELTFIPLDDEAGTIKVEFMADTRDALGANLANTCAEALRPTLEAATGMKVLLAILTNNAPQRIVRAGFRFPWSDLKSGSFGGLELARRICAAAQVAQIDPDRGVTHNKGIMNGISALALATGNDTRALEAAVHAWACRDGRYRGVSTYHIQGSDIVGELAAPICLATRGGAADTHPQVVYNRKILGNPSGPELARIAAALGLAQNFAALMALCGEGIQAGHMRLHQRRLAWLEKGHTISREEA